MATVCINNQHHGEVKTRPTNLGMAQRDQDFGDALSSGSSFGFTMQVDCWNTRFIIDNFNVLHGGSGTLGLHAERFEYGFLANPTSCE
jgi:hypothetical protein